MNIQYKALYRRPAFYISTAVIAIVIIGAALALFMFKQPYASAYSGAGTPANPYLLSDCSDLQELTNETSTYNRYYALENNIDCSATSSWNGGSGFEPIQGFTGVLDGKGFSIDGLHISRSGDDEVGLFGAIESGMILNLTLSNAYVSGNSSVGAVAGLSGVPIYNVWVGNANVIGQTGNVGGIVGSAADGSQNDRVIFVGSVSNQTSGSYVGGLVGRLRSDSQILTSYFAGSVSGLDYTGGIVGFFSISGTPDPLTIENVHTVNSTVSASSRAGGLIGGLNADNFTALSISKSSTSSTTINAIDGGDAGGLVGSISSYSYGLPSAVSITFEDSFARFTMTEAEGGGGIVGKLNLSGSDSTDGATVTMQRVYAVSNITTSNPGAESAYTGGLMGDIIDIYAPSAIQINDSF